MTEAVEFLAGSGLVMYCVMAIYAVDELIGDDE